jgi:hypothetical protein
MDTSFQRELPSVFFGVALLTVPFDDSLMKGRDWRSE